MIDIWQSSNQVQIPLISIASECSETVRVRVSYVRDFLHILYRAFSLTYQYSCVSIKTKNTVCIRIQFYSLWIGLEHQHGRRFFVLVHQHGRRDIM